MNTTKRILLGLALVAALGVGTLFGRPEAFAQNASLKDKFAYASATTTAETTLITPDSGTKFTLKSLTLCAITTAATVTVKDGLSGTTVLTVRCPADTKVDLDERFLGAGLRSLTKDNVLTLTNGTSTTVVADARYSSD